MSFLVLKRILKWGFINFWRNRWLSLAATFVMTLTLLTIGVFVYLNLSIHALAQQGKEAIDLEVHFKDEATDAQIQDLQLRLGTLPEVKSVRYISKEEALETWNQLPINEKTKSQITPDKNILPRGLKIKTHNPQDLDRINTFVQNPPYGQIVQWTSFQSLDKIVQRLLRLTSLIQRVGWGLSLTFTAIAIIVVLNTIRLAIFARREEIEIMKLVGATDAFVRTPFIIEGVLFGLLALILSFLITTAIVYFGAPNLVRSIQTSTFDLQALYFGNVWKVILLELAVGVGVGILGSFFSVRKHLRT